MAGFMLDWHATAAAASSVLSIGAAGIYIQDILKGQTRPNAVSFSLWTILQGEVLLAQLEAGASWSIAVVIILTFATTFVTVLALVGYGYRDYGYIDLFCFIIAIGAALILWAKPAASIFIAIIGDLCAYLPIYKKIYGDPKSEYLPAWILMTIAAILGALSASPPDIPNLAFPIYVAMANGLVVVLALLRRAFLRNPAI